MRYQHIRWILEREGNSEFQSVHQTWRPRDLLFMRQVVVLLKDMEARHTVLEQAREELLTLEQGPRYIKYLQRLKLWYRAASFSWKADQIKFLTSAAGFYADYGAILRLLKTDQLRGKFAEPTTDIGV